MKLSHEQLAMTIHGAYDHECSESDACRKIASAVQAALAQQAQPEPPAREQKWVADGEPYFAPQQAQPTRIVVREGCGHSLTPGPCQDCLGFDEPAQQAQQATADQIELGMLRAANKDFARKFAQQAQPEHRCVMCDKPIPVGCKDCTDFALESVGPQQAQPECRCVTADCSHYGGVNCDACGCTTPASAAQQAQPLTDEMIESEAWRRYQHPEARLRFQDGAFFARDRMAQQAQPEDAPCKECRLEDGTHYLGCSIAQQAHVFRTAQPEDARLELWGKLYDAFLVFFTERGFVGEGASWNADSLAEQAVAVVQNLQQATRT